MIRLREVAVRVREADIVGELVDLTMTSTTAIPLMVLIERTSKFLIILHFHF